MVGGTVAATVPAQKNDRCSTVTPVRSPRQVIDALNAEGPDIDIILSEVDLPMAKGFKMLKYITRDKDLRRIPVIMNVWSAQDEVAVVVKCLRLGAADYLVKPLRTNELLNLWTHMWRRRRMLGLAEKNILNCEFDPMHSDHSDANTNSTTLFSEDDTEEKSRRSSNPEISLSIPREVESNVNVAPGLMNTQFVNLSDDRPNVPEINEQHRAVYPGKLMFGPKKSELRIGQSSAFFTYVKSSMFTTTTLGGDITIEEAPPPQLEGKLSLGGEQDKNSTWGKHVVSDTQVDDCTPGSEKFHNSNSFPDTMSLDTSSTPPSQPQYSPQMSSKISETQQSGNNHHPDVSSFNPYSAYPYYLPGPMNHVMMPSSSSMYQQNMNVPHCPPHHMPGMTSYPYYPVNLCLPGQMPPGMHPWPSYGGSSSNNVNVPKLDRREAALLKFRQKRKDRCFDKKIRYVNRKKLAERRPRVRGQFVRKINGINVDLNGQPTSNDFDEDDDDYEEEEDQAGRDSSSPENNYAAFHS
ncbi:two-component response regulator-like APRR1 [Tanacetum coccineum]